MLKVEIKSTEVLTRSGTSNGRDWNIREQIGWFHAIDKPYPVEMVLSLEKDQPPYAPGVYTVAPTSFYVGKYNKLQVGRLQLLPAQPAAKPAAA